MDYLEIAKERFSADLFAMEAAGIELEAAEPGYARCSFKIEAKHMNAAGTVMGGAIFTIADFAFAVAANLCGPLTQSLTSQITFHSVAKGSRIIAEAKQIRAGRTTCYYNVDITDDTGRLIATTVITGFIHSK